MNADIKHPGIVVEYFLNPVPMMDCPVDNQYFPGTSVLQQLFSSNGDGIKVTESHSFFSFSMMPL